MRQTFNKLARMAAPVALVFATIAATGCATVAPRVQMGPENIAYIEQGLDFYRRTGASPVNYDACGALQTAVNGANAGAGGIVGAVVGGAVVNTITKNPIATIAGAVGGAVAGSSVGRNAQSNDINQLNRDCQLQQAISRASGGTVNGGTVTYQPGGIYQPGGNYRRY
jgi:uncharacterized protein YcfJ